MLIGPPPDHCAHPFRFERDTFAFANELIWQYRFDPVTKAMSVSRNHPPPTYSHRCFMVVKSARQFLYHARFEPGLPIAEPEVYRRLIRQILSRNPRRASAAPERIVIPGYDGLRALSQAHEPLLKAECGAPWQSYFLRSHWRMVFPIWKRHQERIADQLRQGMILREVDFAELRRRLARGEPWDEELFRAIAPHAETVAGHGPR